MKKHIYLHLFLMLTVQHLFSQNLEIELVKFDKRCELGSAQIDAKNGKPPYTILWSNSSTSSSISNLNIGNYNVLITDANLKDTLINFSIDSLSCLPVPNNHFTPNNDLYNDSWEISNLNYYPEFELSVFNRWGQLIHFQTDKYLKWDGAKNDVDLPDATYFYIIYLSKIKRQEFIKGTVSIIR